MNKVTFNEGIQLSGNIGEQTVQLCESAGLMWEVKKEPLFTGQGIRTESFGIIRQDNQQWLGTVGNQYHPVQNWTLAETIIKASEGLGDSFRGGSIKNGGKVFIQMELADEHIANDTVKRHITALNSHDGTTSIGFGSSNTVVVCQNTFYRAYREIEKFRHTMSAEHRIKIAAEALNATIKNDNRIMESYKRMAEKKFDKFIFGSIMKTLFDTDLDTQTKDVSTVKKNQISTFVNRTLPRELASHGETVWGLFNAVTFHENHVVNTRKTEDVSASDYRNQRIMIGSSYRKMNKTYEQIMAWLDENTAELVPVNA